MHLNGYTTADYKKHLEVFFEFLSRNGDIEEGCYTICRQAASVLKRIKQQTDGDNWSLVIGPWIMPISDNDDNFGRRTACLVIYGTVMAKNSELSELSFTAGIVLNPPKETDEQTCCDNLNKDSYRVARLFRFEIGSGHKTTAEPCSHMHYGGRPHQDLKQPPYHDCIEDWIEKPRIPVPPYDFVLLLELILRQFDLGIRRKLFEEEFWRFCIGESEKMIFAGYHKNAHLHFSGSGKCTLLDRLCTRESH